MSDYIKREDAIQAVDEVLESIDHVPQWVWDSFHISFDNLPSVDVVEVVRCKDCKYWDGDKCTGRDIFIVDDDEFCSYGEKKDNE